MTMLRTDLEGSDNGITFNLKPEKPPIAGGFHCKLASFPDTTSMDKLEGGSGAVVMLAVQVNQSDIEEFE